MREQERLAREREAAARLQQQQRSMLVRDLEEELCRHERLHEVQARAAAGLPVLASPLPLGCARSSRANPNPN